MCQCKIRDKDEEETKHAPSVVIPLPVGVHKARVGIRTTRNRDRFSGHCG
jgi:hypothetical protein